jgi:phosphopentomutase
MIRADPSVDTAADSTDHSLEYIPLLVFCEQVKPGVDFGIRQTFADVAATIANIFDLPQPKYGASFLYEIHL